MADNELLMAYSVLDKWYETGLIKQIQGLPAGASSEVSSIENPDETYVPLGPTEGDPKLFTYAYGQDPAILIAKVTTPGPGTQPSTGKYTLAAPDAGGGKAWKILAKDVVLQSTDSSGAVTELATNPYGVAQVENKLYIVEYDTPRITILGVNELNGLPPGGHEMSYPYYNMGPGSDANLPANAKGQAIIAVEYDGAPYLFALYTCPNSSVTSGYDNSILVKLSFDNYGMLDHKQTLSTLAFNAQELIYIENFDGATTAVPGILIPAIGGSQNYGSTNLDQSKLQVVRPFAGSGSSMTLATLLTGDATPVTPATYDIKAVAAPPDIFGLSPIFILTGIMQDNVNYYQNWQLYSTTIVNLRGLNNTPLSAAGLSPIDSGIGSPGYYWDIYYENGTGSASAGDRLWFLKGSPIVIGPAAGFTAQKTFEAGYAAGEIGGINVDSAALVSETMKQAAKGLSLKRGLRGIAAALPEEEEEGK
jgi:hypothetical protein